MSNPQNTPDTRPPVPSKKKKNLADEKEEQDLESIQLSSEAIDVATKFQSALDAFKKYKRKNEVLEREKGDLITYNYNLRVQNEQLQTTAKESNTRLDSERRRYQQRANESDLEIQELKKQIIQLKNEASQLQSRLGNATNVHLGDNDANNSVQLNKAITDIQNKLDEFAMVKGKEVIIHEENASRLLQQYRCTTKIGGGKGKSVLSAALQRFTLETLFLHLNRYLLQSDTRQKNQSQPQLQAQAQPQNPPPANQQVAAQQQYPVNPRSSSLGPPKQSDNNLEVEITTTMTSLCDLVSQLTESRQGSDDVSRITPIKIRQQIYAVLGTRGFCKDGHPFIEQLSAVILDRVGQYRSFKSEERKLEAKKSTTELVREIVHLYFRLRAQEPVPEFNEFIEAGSNIRNNIMEGSWDDDGIDDLEVEICSFPIISVKGKDNVRRVLSKGQVLTRPKKQL